MLFHDLPSITERRSMLGNSQFQIPILDLNPFNFNHHFSSSFNQCLSTASSASVHKYMQVLYPIILVDSGNDFLIWVLYCLPGITCLLLIIVYVSNTDFGVSGYAFVYYEDERDAEDAIRVLDNFPFGYEKRRLSVEWARGERGRHPNGSRANQRPTRTLFVINFDPIRTRDHDIEKHFEPYGKIHHVRIRRNFAFVQFETQEDAAKALECTHMSKILDRVVSVEYALRDDSERGGDRYHDSPRRGGYGRSPSPAYRRRPSPDYGRPRSPVYDRRRSPDYGRPRSPDHIRPRSPDHVRPRSPDRLRPRSPDRLRPRSLDRLRPRSPELGRPRSPEHGRPRSPEHGRPRSPEHGRPRSPEHGRPRSPEHGRPRSPEHGRYRSRSPIRRP